MKNFATVFKPTMTKSQYDLTLTNTAPIILSIDSRYRDTNIYPTQNKYTIQLDQSYREVISLELINVIIPNLVYNINIYNNKLSFAEQPNIITDISIIPGVYDIADLIDAIETEMNTNSPGGATYQVLVNSITHKIQIKQLTPGSATIFKVYFFGFYDNNIPQYRENSLGPILGFAPEDYTDTDTIDSPFPYNLNQLTYLNLYINKKAKFRHIESNNDATKGCFCIIPIMNNSSYIYNKSSAFINNAFIKEFAEPIPQLNQIDIEFRDQNNNLVDFYNQDHLLVFEIKYGAR